MEGERKKVLIVDDDMAQRLIFRSMLESFGFDVCEGSNGVEAFEIANSNDLPDLILLDLMMPVMDGFEYAK